MGHSQRVSRLHLRFLRLNDRLELGDLASLAGPVQEPTLRRRHVRAQYLGHYGRAHTAQMMMLFEPRSERTG